MTGTVRVGTTTLVLDGPRQRDHSCGPRGWWAFNGMWSAFHLADRTRIHAVALSHVPGLLVGYVQRDDITELSAGSTTATVGAPGLATSAAVTMEDPALTIHVEPLAYGALRMVSRDGRGADFPGRWRGSGPPMGVAVWLDRMERGPADLSRGEWITVTYASADRAARGG